MRQKWVWGGSWAPFGRVWNGLGLLLGALGRFLAVFCTLKKKLFSSIGPRWAPKGLLDPSWEGFARILAGFGKVLGRISSMLGCI